MLIVVQSVDSFSFQRDTFLVFTMSPRSGSDSTGNPELSSKPK